MKVIESFEEPLALSVISCSLTPATSQPEAMRLLAERFFWQHYYADATWLFRKGGVKWKP